MKVNPYIFREYDIRGVADIDLNEEVVKNIGRAFGTILKRKGGKKITIGYDVRLSSERIKENVKEGVLETGIDVIEIGIVPTPLLYFSVFKLETDGGIQITGSHNPKEYNGMKLMVFKETLYGEGIQKLKEIIENEDFEKGKGKEKLYEKIIDDYIEDVNKKVKINKRFKFAVDPGNGTCGPVIEKLWKSYKIEFKGINMEPDGNFPSHLPDPTVKEYLDDLFKIMEEDKFDGGIGFDLGIYYKWISLSLLNLNISFYPVLNFNLWDIKLGLLKGFNLKKFFLFTGGEIGTFIGSQKAENGINVTSLSFAISPSLKFELPIFENLYFSSYFSYPFSQSLNSFWYERKGGTEYVPDSILIYKDVKIKGPNIKISINYKFNKFEF